MSSASHRTAASAHRPPKSVGNGAAASAHWTSRVFMMRLDESVASSSAGSRLAALDAKLRDQRLAHRHREAETTERPAQLLDVREAGRHRRRRKTSAPTVRPRKVAGWSRPSASQSWRSRALRPEPAKTTPPTTSPCWTCMLMPAGVSALVTSTCLLAAAPSTCSPGPVASVFQPRRERVAEYMAFIMSRRRLSTTLCCRRPPAFPGARSTARTGAWHLGEPGGHEDEADKRRTKMVDDGEQLAQSGRGRATRPARRAGSTEAPSVNRVGEIDELSAGRLSGFFIGAAGSIVAACSN